MPHLSRPSRLLAAALFAAAAAAADAEVLTPAGDTFVKIGDLGKKAYGGLTNVGVKSDNPGGNNDRLGVFRFELDDAVGSIDGAVLRLEAKKAIENDITLLLYGAKDGTPEDKLDEAAYTAEEREATIDKSGNRIRESQVHDPDPSTKAPEPLATAPLAAGDLVVVFEGEALDAFLNSRDDDDAAFILQTQKAPEKGGTPGLLLGSRETDTPPKLGWGDDAAALREGASTGGGGGGNGPHRG